MTPGSSVALYARHSPGDKQTIESQLDAVRAWCKERDYLIASEFVDVAKSGGSTAGRENFLQMVERVESKSLDVSAVVVWAFDRFGRNYDDVNYFKSLLRRAGCEIISMTEEVPAHSFGRVIESVYDVAAADVLAKIAKNAKRGLHYIASQGYWHGARPPRGYTLGQPEVIGSRKSGVPHTARKLIFDDALYASVTKAWQMKLDGQTSERIHRETRIYAGTNCYVTMWNNRTYTGAIKCGDELFPNAHPAYISVEDFERVQARKRPTPGNAPGTLTGDPFNSRRIHSAMLLSGLLYCGLCGAAMVAHWSKGYGYYKCGRKQRHGDCAQRLIAAWYVEDTLIDWMCDNAITRAKIASLRDSINRELNGDRTDLEGRKTRIEAERRDAEKEITRLVNLAARVGDVDELEQGIRERQRRARELKRDADAIAERLTQKPVEVTDAQIDYLAENIKGVLKDGDPEDVKEVLRGTVARAEVGADTLTIDYLPPLVVFKSMPPRGSILKHNLPVEYIERAVVALPRLLRLPSAA